MKITKRSAIRALLSGILPLIANHNLSAQGPLVSFSPGRRKPPAPIGDLPLCEESVLRSDGTGYGSISRSGCRHADGTRIQSVFSMPDYIPNTATIEVDLGQFESFTFRNSGREIIITRDEMWAALSD